MRTLIVDGTGRNEENSRTKYLANRVIDKLNITDYQFVDLYNIELPFVTTEIIESWKTQKTDTQALKLLKQFEESDRIIFIYPTWNWSVPAIVRAYMDLIIISGRTFGYDKSGKRTGYLDRKSAILISTTGGKSYPRVIASLLKAQDGNNYMKQMLRTLGIKEIDIYSIDNTAYNYNDENGNFDINLYKSKVADIVSKIS